MVEAILMPIIRVSTVHAGTTLIESQTRHDSVSTLKEVDPRALAPVATTTPVPSWSLRRATEFSKSTVDDHEDARA